MRSGEWLAHGAPRWLAGCLPLLLLATHARAEGVAHKRVMVLDIRTRQADAGSLPAITSVIAEAIAKHPAYDVASSDDVRKTMSRLRSTAAAGTESDDALVAGLYQKVDADLIVQGSVGRLGQTYVISLSLIDTKALAGAPGVTATAEQPEDLARAALTCLDRLFKWGGTPEASAFHLPKGKKLSFAISDLKPTGISAETAQNLTQLLSVEVKGVQGASVVSHDDIAAMLQLSAQKMAVGCGDDNCMVQIAGALAVDRLISGDAGKLGDTYIVNLRLIDVRHGTVENRVTETYRGEEEQLLHAVQHAGRKLLGLAAAGTGRLAITANQSPAAVFVDDQQRGQAPLPVEALLPGQHAVRISRDGFFDWQGDVYVDPGQTTSLWAQLKERPQQWYQKWWVWTIVGGVVAGATATAVVVTRPAPVVGHGMASVQ
jgi:hypothetical protein